MSPWCKYFFFFFCYQFCWVRTFLWEYNVKQNICFWWKNVAARLDKKIAAWWKNKADDPTEESNNADTEEEPSTEDSKMALSQKVLKKILSIRNLKRTLSLWNLKATLLMNTLRCFSILNDFCTTKKKNLFSFLVMVYDRVSGENKSSNENFVLGRSRF